jgi:hypothetical protein
MKPASDEKDWFLAVFSGKGGGDGQKMMRIGDNGGDPWKVARARQGLACSGSAAETNLQKNLPHPSTSEVGRFLRKRLVRRHGPRRDRSAADTDRSEIGPYLGSPRTTSGWPKNTSPKRLRGRATSPKAPRQQTRPPAEIGPPQTRTARRSVPTLEVLGQHLGGQKIPHPSASEVGRFLRKRLVRRHGLPQRSVRRGHGSLGDRSLPWKSSDNIWVAKKYLTQAPPR